ncbi:poly(ADP-ribose) glycohydrolase-like isoform X2 [Lycorma delicatula]
MDTGTSHDEEDALTGCTPPKVKNIKMMEKNCEKIQSKNDEQFLNHDWQGVPLEKLKAFNLKDLYPPVKPSDSHTVLFKVPVVKNSTPDPYPTKSVDIWDKDHVRMPHSSHSLSPTSKMELRSRWDLIHEAFSKPIKSSQELGAAILHYNSKYSEKWKFNALHYFFSQTLVEEETEYFFLNILPGIVKLALSLPELVTGALPLLRSKKTQSISLTQKQIASLLANSFLCTFPRRNTAKTYSSEYKNYPDINFSRLYSFGYSECAQEKFKCIVNYFRRVCTNCPEGVITYSRHYVSSNDLPEWSKSNSMMPQLHVNSTGSIEDEGTGMMELDFANKFVGGGVLGRGCVQEEIRFVICPELIVARLFTECLDDTEALIITGVERYNQYKGYGNSFMWAGDVKDQTPRDQYGRRLCVVVAIDAFKFQQAEKQYTPQSINRELNKAYAAFSWSILGNDKQTRLNVATGNWGCGAFGGDVHLKALLQLMVAGQTGRNVAYFTFGNPEFRDKLGDMHRFLTNNKVSVGQLWNLLCRYNSSSFFSKKKANLYSYLYHSITNGFDTTEIKESTNFIKKTHPKTSADLKKNTDKCTELTPEDIDTTFLFLEEEEESETVGDLSRKQSSESMAKSGSIVSNSEGTSKSDTVSQPMTSIEPMEVKSYSVKSKEGYGMCIQKQKDSWARIEESKKDFNEFQIDDDDDDSISSTVHNSSGSSKIKNSVDSETVKSQIVKRKISDYFTTLPNI